jgi:hypothetical protein
MHMYVYVVSCAETTHTCVCIIIQIFDIHSQTHTQETCSAIAEACTLPFAVQSCAFKSEIPQQAVTCMQKCNQTAHILGTKHKYLPDCCGLQCLESCWERQLAKSYKGNDTSSSSAVTTAAVGVGSTAVNGSRIPALNVTLERTPPPSFGNLTGVELEHTNNVYIVAVLSPPCTYTDTPWLCNSSSANSSNLTHSNSSNSSMDVPIDLTIPLLWGKTRKLVDPLTGSVSFDDLTISGPAGEYRVILYATDFGKEEIGRRWGPLSPPKLYATKKWPVYVSNVVVHSSGGTPAPTPSPQLV